MATATKRKRVEIDFLEGSPDRNLGLQVKDKIFWVSREELAKLSPVFNSMLFGQFQEANKEIIELKDKDPDQILEMLQCLFDGKSIEETNLESLLRLGDEYEIGQLMEQCSEFVAGLLHEESKIYHYAFSDNYYNVDDRINLFLTAIRYKLKKAVRQGVKALSQLKFDNLQPHFQEMPSEIRNAIIWSMAALFSDHNMRLVGYGELDDDSEYADGSRVPECSGCGTSKYVDQCKFCRFLLCWKCKDKRSFGRGDDCSGHCTTCHICGKKFGSTVICCDCIDAMIIPELEKIGF